MKDEVQNISENIVEDTQKVSVDEEAKDVAASSVQGESTSEAQSPTVAVSENTENAEEVTTSEFPQQETEKTEEESKVVPPVKTEKNTMKVATLAKADSPKKFERKRPERPVSRREDSEFDKKLVEVRRVTKVVKGGKTMRFSALVVVGNKKGLVGVGTGKANEVPEAVEKASANAKRNLISVPIVGTSIPHKVIGRFSASRVLMFPAPEGRGVIAGGSARAVVELAGIKDIVTKAHGSNNKINGVKATIDGLKQLRTREEIAALRGKSPEEI